MGRRRRHLQRLNCLLKSHSIERQPPEAERCQLTVMFCDLVGSMALSAQLDSETLREVVRAYQEVCAKVIARFEGQIAQHLGDGLLVYFGYPTAHEDDAQRAVRSGLGIVEGLEHLNTHLKQEKNISLSVRVGIHTGLVVVGEMGGGERREQLALGETPNIAARLEGLAEPNTLLISCTTYRLIGRFFECEEKGAHVLKGISQPMELYQVKNESTVRSRLDMMATTALTPLVGQQQKVTLLLERWAQVKAGNGHVVLLNREAGIGKSRMVQVAEEPQAWLTKCHCSPYHQTSALYPVIDMFEQVVFAFERDESVDKKLSKLEGFVVQYGFRLMKQYRCLRRCSQYHLTNGTTLST